MKVAIYGKLNCDICTKAKDKMRHFSLEKVDSPNQWVDGTWVERDAQGVMSGATDNNWRGFPDVDVLAFITMEATDKVPLIWIDGTVHYYAEAMRELKRLQKLRSSVVVEAPNEPGDGLVAVGAA